MRTLQAKFITDIVPVVLNCSHTSEKFFRYLGAGFVLGNEL
jgi:hypothetical protein